MSKVKKYKKNNFRSNQVIATLLFKMTNTGL